MDNIQMDPNVFATQLSNIMSCLDTLTHIVNDVRQTQQGDRERLDRVETRLEHNNEREEERGPNRNVCEEHGSLIQYWRQNVHDPDDKYLKSIKLMFLLLTIIRTLNSSCNGFDTWTNISQGIIFLKLEKSSLLQ